MPTQSILPEGVNAIGIAAMVAFILCWIGVFVAAVPLFRHMNPTLDLPKRTGWIGAVASAFDLLFRGGGEAYASPSSLADPETRKRFLPFFGLCALGVLCMLVALLFGGWITGPGCVPGVYQC